jgi:hypothetical protein
MGPRRAGKSFVCIHTLNRTGNFGYVNFDAPALSNLENTMEYVSALKQVYLPLT